MIKYDFCVDIQIYFLVIWLRKENNKQFILKDLKGVIIIYTQNFPLGYDYRVLFFPYSKCVCSK